jgi:hypothetical protein
MVISMTNEICFIQDIGIGRSWGICCRMILTFELVEEVEGVEEVEEVENYHAFINEAVSEIKF